MKIRGGNPNVHIFLFRSWSYRDQRQSYRIQHGCVLAAAVNLETVAEVIVLDDPTITPIARRRGDAYEIDLVLHNNITTDEHPMGVYHPHAELHHIKKENIGLIEVMGLAVLPARLKTELAALEEAILTGSDIANDVVLSKHAVWVEKLKEKHTFTKENTTEILKEEVGQVFAKVLEHAGVYQRNAEGKAALLRFVAHVNY